MSRLFPLARGFSKPNFFGSNFGSDPKTHMRPDSKDIYSHQVPKREVPITEQFFSRVSVFYYWVTVRLPGSSLGFGVHLQHPFNPPLSPSQNNIGLKVYRPIPFCNHAQNLKHARRKPTEWHFLLAESKSFRRILITLSVFSFRA